MISLSLTTWLHLGRGVTRVVLGSHLGPEIPGPVLDLAHGRAALASSAFVMVSASSSAFAMNMSECSWNPRILLMTHWLSLLKI